MTTPTVRRSLLVGLLATALVALTGCEAYDLPLPGSPVDKDASIAISAEFRDVLSLVPRSPVKVNDVTVGEVVAVKRHGWHAITTLRLQNDVRLPANVVADIRQTSLLGEKYVALTPAPGQPETGRLRDGARLGLDRTGRNPELEEVLGALSFLLNGGGVGQLKTITTEVNKIFDGRQNRVRDVLGRLEVLLRGLDRQKGDIIRAMEGMNALAATLNRERATVTGALDTFPGAVKVLADQRAQLMRMLKALDRLGRVGTRVIGASKDDILANLRNLEPVVRKIADVNTQLPDALGLLISFPFPIESNNIVHGDYANTSIVFSIDLDNLYKNFVGNGGGTGLPPLPSGKGGLPDLGKLKLPKSLTGGGGGGIGGLPQLPGLSSRSSTSSYDSWNHYATNVAELMGGGRS